MTVTFPTLLPQAIAPSLQAAALRMTGPEFNDMTEQIWNHVLEGNDDGLRRTLNSHRIQDDVSHQIARQIIAARAIFFGGPPRFLIKTLDAAVASLIEVLDDPNGPEEEQMRACSILSHIGGPRSIQALIGAFATFGYDGFLIFHIGLLIRTFGDEATQPLIAGLRDGNPSVRGWSANLLGRIGKAEALAPLFSASRNEMDIWVETTMKRALEDLEDSLDRRDAGLIFEDLKSGNPKKRRRAAKRLGKIGNPRCIDALIRALNDENGEVRWQAFSSLVHMRIDAHLENRKRNHPEIDEALRTALNNEGNEDIHASMAQMLEALYG